MAPQDRLTTAADPGVVLCASDHYSQLWVGYIDGEQEPDLDVWEGVLQQLN